MKVVLMRVNVKVLPCLLAFSFGLAGETLLFLRHQCARVEASLLADFRVLAFVSEKAEGREKVVEEKIRALDGVRDVRFISREAELAELKERDPDVAQSVALLGENPLPPAFEIRLFPEAAARLPAWLDSLYKLEGLSDVRFKPMEIQAILQTGFYRRFIELAMSAAALVWFAGCAAGLWFSTRKAGAASLWREVKPRMEYGLVFACIGAGMIYLAALPFKAQAGLWAWPSLPVQAALVLAGAVGAGLWSE